VLVTVLAGEIGAEPLHHFGLALLRWWMGELAGGVALRGFVRRLGVMDLRRWWGGFDLLAGCLMCDWWVLAVELHLGANVCSIFSVASSGCFRV
jgi:hypothetical protein